MHSRSVYDTLMRCAAATLTEFAANPRWLGGIGAFTLGLRGIAARSPQRRRLGGNAGGQPAGARGRAGLHASRGDPRDRVLRALQARALARGRATQSRPRGHCRAHAARMPGPTRRPSSIRTAWPHTWPEPACAGLVAMRDRTAHRCARISRESPSSPRRRLMQRALTLPAVGAETYTAHACAITAAVQHGFIWRCVGRTGNDDAYDSQ